jgi:hypothetical protein
MAVAGVGGVDPSHRTLGKDLDSHRLRGLSGLVAQHMHVPVARIDEPLARLIWPKLPMATCSAISPVWGVAKAGTTISAATRTSALTVAGAAVAARTRVRWRFTARPFWSGIHLTRLCKQVARASNR